MSHNDNGYGLICLDYFFYFIFFLLRLWKERLRRTGKSARHWWQNEWDKAKIKGEEIVEERKRAKWQFQQAKGWWKRDWDKRMGRGIARVSLTYGKSIKLLTTIPTETPYSQTWPSRQPECLTDWRKEGVGDMERQLIDRQSEKTGILADHNQGRRWTAHIEEGRPNTSQNHSRIEIV